MLIDDWSDLFDDILSGIKRGAYDVIDWAHRKYVEPGLRDNELYRKEEDYKR